MAEPTRVFCKDCKNRQIVREIDHWTGGTYDTILDSCAVEPAIVPHPIRGDEPHYVKCIVRNSGLNCALFEAAPIAEPKPVKPWWRFW